MYKKVNNEVVTLSFDTFKKRKIVKTCKEFHVLKVKEEATGNIARSPLSVALQAKRVLNTSEIRLAVNKVLA